MAKKSFREFFSDLEQYYLVDLNPGISFDDLYITFPEKLFWSCEKGHNNYQTPRVRTKNKCKTCSHNQSRKFLGEFHPDLLDDFDLDLNENIDPRSLFSRSPGIYWWRCRESNHQHSYQATVRAKIAGRRCPYCAGIRILPGYNDWQTLSDLESLIWDDAKNLESNGEPVKKEFLGVDNREMRYWTCLTGNHERVISISSAINGQKQGKSCRTCAGYAAVTGVNDVATLYPQLLEKVDTKLNSDQVLMGLHPGSALEIYWRCNEGHKWRRTVREEIKAKGCGKCLGREVWTGHNDLASQFPELALELARDLNQEDSEVNDLPPEEIHSGSNARFWWRCIKHGHTWRTSVQKRTLDETYCPFCSDRRVWPGFNDLYTKRPDLIDEIDFDAQTNIEVRKLLWVSHTEIKWKCQEGHKWQTPLVSRTSNNGKKPTGCPDCADYGFNPSEPAVIYFIRQSNTSAMKVGITNTDTGRLAAWAKAGWETIRIFEFALGSQALYIEKSFHKWRRHIMGVPDLLGKLDVGRLGGWTETFDENLLQVNEVIAQLNLLAGHAFGSAGQARTVD